jgi:hypothetical protein
MNYAFEQEGTVEVSTVHHGTGPARGKDRLSQEAEPITRRSLAKSREVLLIGMWDFPPG